jgi:ribosomal protein S7
MIKNKKNKMRIRVIWKNLIYFNKSQNKEMIKNFYIKLLALKKPNWGSYFKKIILKRVKFLIKSHQTEKWMYVWNCFVLMFEDKISKKKWSKRPYYRVFFNTIVYSYIKNFYSLIWNKTYKNLVKECIRIHFPRKFLKMNNKKRLLLKKKKFQFYKYFKRELSKEKKNIFFGIQRLLKYNDYIQNLSSLQSYYDKKKTWLNGHSNLDKIDFLKNRMLQKYLILQKVPYLLFIFKVLKKNFNIAEIKRRFVGIKPMNFQKRLQILLNKWLKAQVVYTFSILKKRLKNTYKEVAPSIDELLKKKRLKWKKSSKWRKHLKYKWLELKKRLARKKRLTLKRRLEWKKDLTYKYRYDIIMPQLDQYFVNLQNFIEHSTQKLQSNYIYTYNLESLPWLAWWLYQRKVLNNPPLFENITVNNLFMTDKEGGVDEWMDSAIITYWNLISIANSKLIKYFKFWLVRSSPLKKALVRSVNLKKQKNKQTKEQLQIKIEYKKIGKFNFIYKLNRNFFSFFRHRKHNLFSYFFFDKFRNRFMPGGKRLLITSLFNKVLLKFKFYLNMNLQNIIKILLFVLRPLFNYVERRVAKQWFKVPIPIKWHKQYKIAINWIFWTIKAYFSRSLEKKIFKSLCKLLVKKRNSLIKRRSIFLYTMVDNRYFTSFRWH